VDRERFEEHEGAEAAVELASTIRKNHEGRCLRRNEILLKLSLKPDENTLMPNIGPGGVLRFILSVEGL
jgi:hypothetical protein